MPVTNVQTNEALVHRFNDLLFDPASLDDLDEVLSEDFQMRDLGMADVMDTSSREEFLAIQREVLDAVPDMASTTDRIVSADDTVACLTTVRGTPEKPLLGIEPSGRSFEVATASFYTIADGKIERGVAITDQATLLRQLGVLPDAPLAE